MIAMYNFSLAERLQHISIKENLDLDNGTIASLVDKSESDIRSCLSTLQFLKKKKCTSKDELFTQIGMKDKSKGIFAVWQDIFTVPTWLVSVNKIFAWFRIF